MRNTLFEISAIDPSTGLTTLIHMSAVQATAAGVYLNSYEWKPAIVAGPSFSFANWTDGQPQPMDVSYGQISFLTNAVFSNLDWTKYSWEGSLATVWTGNVGDAFASYRQLWSGSLGPIQRDNDQTAHVTLLGPEASLQRNLLTAAYAGTGGQEGPSNAIGTLKPYAVGACVNVQPILIDPTYQIYQYHAYGSCAVSNVYENALDLGTATSTVSTYAALVSASLVPGQWAAAPAVGMFRLGAEPTGKITVDIGTAAAVGSIVSTLIQAAGLSTSKIDSSITGTGRNASLYAADQTVIIDAIRDLALSGGKYLISDAFGKFYLADHISTKTAGALNSDRSSLPLVRPDTIAQAVTAPPAWRVKIGHTKVWSVNQISEVSSAVATLGTDMTAVNLAATNAQTAANAAQATANVATTRLASMANDNVLDRTDKLQVVQQFEAITAEKTGLNSTAAGLSITTENTNYTTAYTALNTYLTGLSPAYNDTTQDTTIVATTFKGKFNDYFAARQTLENAIAAASALRANWPNVTGTGKPADNATVGATLGTTSGTTNIYLSGGPAVVTTDVITNVGTSAYFAGQGPWATSIVPIVSVTNPGNNLLFNAGFTRQLLGWNPTPSSGVWSPQFANGLYSMRCAATTVGADSTLVSDPFYVGAGVALTMQLANFGFNTTNSFTLKFYTHPTDAYQASEDVVLTMAGVLTKVYVTSPVLTGNRVVRIELKSNLTSTGGYLIVQKLKVETGTTATAWSDEATTPGLYYNGPSAFSAPAIITTDSLKPGEAGANVTETRTALYIVGQGTGATASTLAGLDSTANTKLAGIASGATKNAVTQASSAPSSPVDGDIWIDSTVTPYLAKLRISGAWQISANYITGTAQLTDTAGLGTTAVWTSITGSGKPSDNADVTAASQQSITIIPPIAVTADYTGTVDSGQLPLTVSVRRLVGATDQSPSTTYSITTSSGITATVNNTSASANRGDITVTAITASSGFIYVTSSYSSISLYETIAVARNNAAPPSGGGGGGGGSPGSPASTSSITAPGSTTTHATASSNLAVVVGSSGQVNLTAPLTYHSSTQGTIDPTSDPITDTQIATKWQYSANGTSGWADVGTETVGSGAEYYFSYVVPKGTTNSPGSVSVSVSKTGLTSGATAYFRLQDRMVSGGTSITSVTGTATATPV